MIENILGFDNDSEDMFDEIMSVLTTANPNDMVSNGNSKFIEADFHKFDDNLTSFAMYGQSRNRRLSKCRCGRVRKTCCYWSINGQYKEDFPEVMKKRLNQENVDDRKAMIESINALIDTLGILNNGLTTYRLIL